MNLRQIAAFGLVTLLTSGQSTAAPRHDICADLGDSFAFGVSSYGSLRDWAPDAKAQHGADFRFLYVYILNGGMDDPDNFKEWYVKPFGNAAQQMGAVPVYTFYQLLDLGKAAGYSGAEADIVQQTLNDPALMRTYFDNFVWLLEVVEEIGPPAIVHVEPDSWGFMMWAMGIEGNADATFVPVQVAGSGHPDTAGFADHAGGLGHALIALRDNYAPDVRLGWHASNFRVGTRPEVVVEFYGHVGEWDVLIGEHPHMEANESTWWEPWDPDRVAINLSWFSTVTAGASVPMILWQTPIGTSDWHLVGDLNDRTMLDAYIDAGAVALLFEHIAHRGEQNPDDIRASGDLGTTPPATSPAGGTAADMRTRVANYSASPSPWPDTSFCGSGGGTGGASGSGGSGGASVGGAGGSAGAAAGGQGGTSAAGQAGANPAVTEEDSSGCACTVTSPHRNTWGSLGLMATLWALRRRPL